jgi:fatty acid/phospholipid biosynthesis enzyme
MMKTYEAEPHLHIDGVVTAYEVVREYPAILFGLENTSKKVLAIATRYGKRVCNIVICDSCISFPKSCHRNEGSFGLLTEKDLPKDNDIAVLI